MNKTRILAITLGIIVMNVAGCKSKPSEDNISRELEATSYTVSYPTPVSGALHNRGMGWISLEEQTDLGKLDLGKNGTLPEIDNIGIQTSWALIEKEPGIYDFSLIDETIDYWTSIGKRINFRICTDSLSLPEVFFGAPKWLNESPYNVPFEQYTYVGAVKARVNDITNATYKQHFERFMSALSQRYINNPYLDTIDIRGYGMYGEWHSGHSFASMEERMFTLAYIVDIYAREFAKNGKVIFLSNSWDYQGVNDDGSSAATEGNALYEDYIIWSALDHGMKLEYVGYRRDGLAGNGVTKYSTDEKLLVELIKSGKKVSNIGEFFTGFQSYVDNIYGMTPMEAVDELIFKSRANYATVMGWINIEVVNIIEAGYADVFNRGNHKLGYRLKVDQAKFPTENAPGQTITIKTQISNSGVGRFTLTNHKIALYLIDSSNRIKQTYINNDYDLRLLLNGEIGNIYSTFTLNSHLAKGTYTLAIAIIDQDNQPSIRLAQVGDYDSKIYPLGNLIINKTSKVNAYFTEKTYDALSTYDFKANKKYEVTFEYTPTFELEDFLFDSNHGYVAKLTTKKGGNDKTLEVSNFKDVSGEAAIKTLIFTTDNYNDYRLTIEGTGEYKNKITISKVYIEERTGYLEKIEENYDLFSTSSAWYSDSYYATVVTNGAISGANSVLIENDIPRTENDILFSDPTLLMLKPNNSYSISFKSEATRVGGNGTYNYLKLFDQNGEVKKIAEWYDRPDEGAMYKQYSFITPNSEGLYLAFGIKNSGAYMVDEINVLKDEAGQIILGNDVVDVNNVRPFTEGKGLGYQEGFEGVVLNDSIFTYGFNRWGSLTQNKEEVISGQYSISSRLVDEVYQYNDDNNWFEFGYSNDKYIQLEANTNYRITFSYKIIEKIYLNTDPSSVGYGYFFARSRQGLAPDGDVQTFAGSNIEINEVKTAIFNFQTGASDDYYLVLGLYGRGVVTVDDIVITKR